MLFCRGGATRSSLDPASEVKESFIFWPPSFSFLFLSDFKVPITHPSMLFLLCLDYSRYQYDTPALVYHIHRGYISSLSITFSHSTLFKGLLGCFCSCLSKATMLYYYLPYLYIHSLASHPSRSTCLFIRLCFSTRALLGIVRLYVEYIDQRPLYIQSDSYP